MFSFFVDWCISSIVAILFLLLPPRWVAKIATFILRVRVPALERERIGEIVHADNKHPSTPSTSTNKRRPLLVAFAGGALQLGGQTRPEFVNSTADLDCDRLFVTDPSNAWYTDEQFAIRFEAVLAPYGGAVVFVGNCLGATGALRFAHLAKHVLCINPDIDVVNHSDWRIRFAASRIDDSLQARSLFVERLVQSVGKCRGTVRIYVDGNPTHRHEARLLQSLLDDDETATVDLQVVHCDVSGASGEEKLPRKLRNSGELSSALREFLSTASS
jgi:hypothetical protein